MTTFYKDKGEVKLKPGQTLGFTAGKGYFAAGTPAAPKPSPAPTKPSSKAEPTATRPIAAETPTAPPSHASAPPTTRRTGEPDTETARRSDARVSRSPASTTPQLSESTALYKRASDVPLGPGQTVGYAGERGYYAAGRPQPTKASTTPRPSTVKVTAVSTRASTESPLVEHRETRDGRTTVRLSHATKPTDHTSHERKVAAHTSDRSAKPTKEPARRADVETKKASSRVHERLAKNKERSDHAKSGIGHHPGHRHTKAPLAEAARASRPSGFPSPFAPSLSAFQASLKLVGPPEPFEILGFAGETAVQASVPGVAFHVDVFTGDLTVRVGNQKLLTVSLDVLSAHAVEVAEALHTAIDKVKSGATVTRVVDGHEVTLNGSKEGVSVSETSPSGIKTTVTLNWLGQLVISISGTADVSSPRVPGRVEPVNLAVTTTLTPARPFRGPDDGSEPQTVPVRLGEPVHHHSWEHKALVSVGHFFSNWFHGDVRFGKAVVHGVEHLHPPHLGPAPPWYREPEPPGA